MPSSWLLDNLRLEVSVPPAGPNNNIVTNPTGVDDNGVKGAWGWLTPAADPDKIVTLTPSGLEYVPGTPTNRAMWFTTETLAIPPGDTFAAARITLSNITANPMPFVKLRFEFVAGDGSLVSSSAQTAAIALSATPTATVLPAVAIPATAVGVRLRVDCYSTTAGANPTNLGPVLFTSVRVATGTTAPSPTGYVSPWAWTNILGDVATIVVKRAALNLGTLTAQVVNPALSPELVGTLKAGRLFRLTYQASPGVWSPLTVGRTTNARVDHYPLNAAVGLPDRVITVTGVDNNTPLANTPQSASVGTALDLIALLENTGVPWRIGRSRVDQLPLNAGAVLLTNDNASVMDQVALVRDSLRGQAWVNAAGVLRVYPSTDSDGTLEVTPSGGPDGTGTQAWQLPPTAYNPSIGVGYDTSDCINSVLVTRRYTGPDGQAVEATYGPFENVPSIRRNGRYAAQFTVVGVSDAAVPGYAAAVLAGNADPVLRPDKVAVPITSAAGALARAGIDLYDSARITNPATGLDTTPRVTSITHTITATNPDTAPADRGTWLMELEFTTEGGTAAPQAQPGIATSPPTESSEGWQNITLATGTGTLQYAVHEGVVHLQAFVTGLASVAVGSTITLATAGIPADYCPAVEQRWAAFSTNSVGFLGITPAGDVTLHASTGAMTGAVGSGSYSL